MKGTPTPLLTHYRLYSEPETSNVDPSPPVDCPLPPAKPPHPTPTPAYPADKLVNVQALVPVGLEDSDNEAVEKVPSLLQVPALFVLSFQVCLSWDEPHVAPPRPGFLATISNLEHP